MLVLLGLARCDSTAVNPFIDSGNYYSVYGYLDTFADSQFVRVVPLRGRLERIQSETDPLVNLDAFVSTVDLNNGDSVIWTPRLVQFRDSTYGYLFGARFNRVWPGHTYRLTVRRSDGVMTAAETTVPTQPGWNLAPPEMQNDSLLQTMRLEGVANQPDDLVMVYQMGLPGSIRPPRFQVPYGRSGRRENGAWTVDIQLTRDTDIVRTMYAQQFGQAERLTLFSLTLVTATRDAAWDPPGGAFDPAVLLQPGVFSNVEGGFGFFGSIAHYSHEWVLDEATNERLGFETP